ncbi:MULTISPECIES: DUF3052 domain-containing protein [unclassified Gordonia (in: high G+C Gram-positive bacteria)]|uniref:DUF3052 domain-containing protein n=1 Tax=unclassified Gordonia (in: high G+C Gram-positive bacteria) TaxID=2657482 RepID=UPI001F0F6F8C|nr:DUF3052 domain-containing protein [Gordonia sp. ABSL49_1]MCH5645381.1 DUF3052 domain-containing protein [Gordonia sp. ABSL49_1]
MVAATDGSSGGSRADKLGLESGMVVQELGWDEDTDDDLRADIEDAIGAEMLDDDADDVIDMVLLWWRDDDGDLVDELMDVISPLADDGFVWVVSPKTGNTGYVDPSEIAEAATTAGLTQTSVVNLGEWSGSRLVQPKARPGKRA